jgi:hypothetical protein
MEMKGRGAENVEGFVDTGALQDRAQFYLPWPILWALASRGTAKLDSGVGIVDLAPHCFPVVWLSNFTSLCVIFLVC